MDFFAVCDYLDKVWREVVDVSPYIDQVLDKRLMGRKNRQVDNNIYYGKYEINNISHQAFIEEYLKDGNATRAYGEAFPDCTSETARRSGGHHLATNHNIKSCIKAIRSEMQKSTMADAVEIRERLTAILRGEVDAETVVVEGVGNGHSEARLIKIKPSHNDVIKSADKLLKVLGAYENTKAVAGQSITVNVTTMDIAQKTMLEDLKRAKWRSNNENKTLGLAV